MGLYFFGATGISVCRSSSHIWWTELRGSDAYLKGREHMQGKVGQVKKYCDMSTITTVLAASEPRQKWQASTQYCWYQAGY
jgi:hypothetical protein